PFKSPENDS
ncbi:hypothetical protein D039_0183B, partial [Vibrio parahaemolyticus EKP-028]